MSGLLVCLVCAAFFGAVAAWGVREAKKRTEAMRAAAREMGFVFADGDFEPAALEGLKLFQHGYNRQFGNHMGAEAAGARMRVFDYRYTTGGGKSRSTHFQTVFFFQSPRLRLPRFAAQPEGVLSGLAEALGFRDIDFAEDPEFSRAVDLSGAPEAEVRALFDATKRAALMANRALSVQGAGDRLVVFRKGRPQEPGELRAFVAEGQRLAAVFAGATGA